MANSSRSVLDHFMKSSRCSAVSTGFNASLWADENEGEPLVVLQAMALQAEAMKRGAAPKNSRSN